MINLKYKKKKLLLIDIDGVACNHAFSIVKKINEEYSLNFEVKDVTTWDYNFGPITFTQAVEKYYHDDNFIINMDATPGFHNFLKRIREVMLIQFATNRKKYCHLSTQSWIDKNFGPNLKVNFIDKKINFRLFDFLIDDNIDEILLVAEYGKKGFLYCRPWNENEITKKKLTKFKNIYFIKDFLEVFKII